MYTRRTTLARVVAESSESGDVLEGFRNDKVVSDVTSSGYRNDKVVRWSRDPVDTLASGH